MKREVIRKPPGIPAKWDYRSSVKRMKAVVWKWKNVSVQMLSELWIAHEMLTRQGARTDLIANATKSHTWQDYCEDIGLNSVTAWRWLKSYDPVGRKLIEAEPSEARTALVPRAARPADPEELLMREIRPRLEKMNLAHRLRVAVRILRGR